jgi:uncharacterized membrane protein YqjE
MAQRNRITTKLEADGASGPSAPPAEPKLAELLKDLASDSAVLVRQEIGLAKAELRTTAQSYVRGAAMMAAGGAVLLLAGLTLTAFLVVLIGSLIGNYWLAALLVGLFFTLVGGGLILAGKRRLDETPVTPETTVQTLQDNREWAEEEIRDLRRELT